MFSKFKFLRPLALALLIAALLTACSQANVTPTSSPDGQPTSSTSTVPVVETTAAPLPTPTPLPMALTVNGEGVTLAEFQAELLQLQEAHQTLGKTVSEQEQAQQVLDSLTDSLLLAQGAAENGFTLDDAALQAEVNKLAEQMGGEDALRQWQAQYGYDEAAFLASLRRNLAAAWQRDQIIEAVPTTAEQVHARQILVLDESTAKIALGQVNVPGVNFDNYAFAYDTQIGGDLGWFPRGYLVQPAVEEAAFALQPGEISPIIETEIGYHIIKVLERETDRPLSPDALRVLQLKALQDWLDQRREASQVEILLP